MLISGTVAPSRAPRIRAGPAEMRVETPNARFPFPALDGAKCAKVQQLKDLKVQSNWHATFFLQLEMSGPNKKPV